MSTLEPSEVWRHLARALGQLAPLADSRAVTAADRTRALEHLELVAQANSALLDRHELTRYEARLINSEITRLRAHFQQPAPPPANRPGQPPAVTAGAQAAFGRINRLQSALAHLAESGECRREVLRCVLRGIGSDLAVLSNARELTALPEDCRERAQGLVRETQRYLQTISVQQEIQAAMDSPDGTERARV